MQQQNIEQLQQQLNQTKAIAFDRQTAVEQQLLQANQAANELAEVIREVATLVKCEDNEVFKTGFLAAKVHAKLAPKHKNADKE